MNVLEIVVAGLAFVFIGAALAALTFFCVYMLRMMSALEKAAKEVVAAVAVVGKMESILEKSFGEGSPTARAAKSVGSLSENLPMLMAGMKGFSDTMSVFFKAAFNEKEVERVIPSAPPVQEFTGQIPYSEADAAQYERAQAAARERVDLSKEELATMRTESPKSEPEPEEAA